MIFLNILGLHVTMYVYRVWIYKTNVPNYLVLHNNRGFGGTSAVTMTLSTARITMTLSTARITMTLSTARIIMLKYAHIKV